MPTRPMSWWSGSQLTAESSDVVASPAGPLMAPMFAHRLRCDSATPLGAEGDPEGNRANGVASNDGGAAGAGGGATLMSRPSHDSTSARSGQLARTPSHPAT